MPPTETTIRTATPEDSAVILHHRRRMFEDMREGTAQDLDRMVEATAAWLVRSLSDGSYRGWLAENVEGKIVAGGGVLVSSWPAGPRDHYPRRALIINVYTELEFRRQGLARRLMLLMIQWLKDEGFTSVSLHASAEGRPLYDALGFHPTNEMRLSLK